MSICDAVQNILADEGIDAVLADETLRLHLDECAECQSIRDALIDLDDALASLPEHEPSEQIVATSLQTVAASTRPGGFRVNRRHLAGAMAATVAGDSSPSWSFMVSTARWGKKTALPNEGPPKNLDEVIRMGP